MKMSQQFIEDRENFTEGALFIEGTSLVEFAAIDVGH